MRIQKLCPTAQVPLHGSQYSAGYDLFAAIPEAVVIPAHTTLLIGTGWAMEIPEGKFGAIFARSGLAVKEGLRPANCIGVIDSDYRGEVKVALHNDTDLNRVVTPGERIAQLIILDFTSIDFQVVEELSDTNRGEGGFGSTGK